MRSMHREMVGCLVIFAVVSTGAPSIAQDTPATIDSGFSGGVATSFGNGSTSSFGPNATPGLGAANYTNGRLSDSPRYLRTNRPPFYFVGTDRRDLLGFVGRGIARAIADASAPPVTQAPPPAPRVIAVPPRRTSVNRIRQIPAASLPPEPPLVVAFTAPTVPDVERGRQIEDHLRQLPRLAYLGPVEVSVTARVAVLTGEVPSFDLLHLVETVVAMEPGVDSVQNRLVVTDSEALPDTALEPPCPDELPSPPEFPNQPAFQW